MQFSLIIATYNRKDLLLRCLAAAATLDHPDYEIIVVDDGSTDGSLAAVRERFPQVRYLFQSRNTGEPAARNRGLQAAHGAIIAFTDDDCVVPVDWLQRHAQHYTDPHIAAAGGPQVCRAPNFLEQFDTVRYGVKFQRLQTIQSIREFEHLITGNLTVRREVFDRIGGFDERFATGCDSDFVRRLSRAGYAFVRDPGLAVEHLKVHTLASYLRTRFHRGCGAVMTDATEGTLVWQRFVPIVNPIGGLEHWQHLRKHYGGGFWRGVGFWTLAAVARCIDVAGRAYYYRTVARRDGAAMVPPPALPS